MILESKNKLIWWAYLPERMLSDKIPDQTNLCKIFWRTVFLTPLFTLFFGAFAIATCWIWIPIVLVIKVKPIGDFYDRVLNRVSEKRKKSVVFAYLKSLKDKTCVIVDIERDAGSTHTI